MTFQASGSDSRSVPEAIESAVCARVLWRLVPLMMVLFFVNTLDRVNVAFAALQMNEALGFSPAIYGWGAGIFFIGYFIFEVPSNVIMAKVGARLWMARIMLTWGIISCATAFVRSPMSFYVVRFLLGVAEAGFIPGMIFYLGTWLPKRYLARASGLFFIAAPITTVVGAPLSSWLLQLHGLGGLGGWQWMFILEGIPAILLTFAVLFYLTDRPADAKWLSASERDWLIRRLDGERAAIEAGADRNTLWRALSSPRVLTLCAVYFCVVVGLYGVGFWIPQIVRRAGLSTMEIGFVAAIPYIFASLGCYFWGRHSDQKGERRWHIIGASVLAAVGLACSGIVEQPIWAVVALCVAATGIYAVLPVLWSLPHGFLTGAGAAAGIALINSVGNLGGFAGPYLVGWLKGVTGGFQIPLLCLSGSLLLAAFIVLVAVRDPLRRDGSRLPPPIPAH